jgi:hypothetical protein
MIIQEYKINESISEEDKHKKNVKMDGSQQKKYLK